MVYLEYNPSEGNHVEVVHEVMPILANGNLVARSDDYKAGDEFEYYIVVNSVDENDYITSSASVRQAPAAKYVLERLKEKEVDIDSLKSKMPVLESKIEALGIGKMI